MQRFKKLQDIGTYVLLLVNWYRRLLVSSNSTDAKLINLKFVLSFLASWAKRMNRTWIY